MSQNLVHKNSSQFFNFQKLSIESLDRVLDALHAEIDTALDQNRLPCVEGVFQRLGSLNTISV